ncbi:Izh3p [Sugiyamaella lignohabitans]|uniref:Izh3p n=1 Tax=Sugiyamaella lignohabitans TaxID=796027 RepID=A0A170QXJ6_9ASCO|nr:Izh3p [Sugiyamaella lignohabitans]ANB15945.1 Izh3p [Sugiyamaella lignohabitans]
MSSTAVPKTQLAHRRKPSTPPPVDSDNLEEIILHKLDSFLYKLETKLDRFEAFGLQKLSQVDESVQHAYDVLVKVRKGVIGEGWRKAEALVKIIEDNYEAMAGQAISDEDDDQENKDKTLRPKKQKVNSKTTKESADENASNGGLGVPSIAAVTSTSTYNRVSEVLGHLETKLQDVEEKYSYLLDSHTLSTAVATALHAAKSRLLTYDELPVEWRENPYIIRGYRFYKGYMDCIYSLVKVHNETCNIWTHVIGFFVMLSLAFFHLPHTLSWKDSSVYDKLTMIVFLVAAMKCLVCSAVWHTFNGIAHLPAKNKFACVDYTGITVLIAASILTTEYTALYCKPFARNVYMAVTALSGLGGAAFTWDPKFDSPEARGQRIIFFVGFAVAGLLGFLHASVYHGLLSTFFFYLPVFKSLFCYCLGVVVYAFLIPERWFPGTIFDFFGMSHNLWHICVFGGIYYHYVATVNLLEGAHAFSCSAH